jgi:hypothetical protein
MRRSYVPYGDLSMTSKNYRTGTWLILISLAVMAAFSACAAGPVGIFASIAQETDINANRTKAFNDANASFVGLLGTKYYAIVGTGRLYEKPVTGGKWNRTSLPSGLSDAYAQGAAVANSILYLVLGANNPRIYSYDGTDLTALVFDPSDERIVRVLGTETQLFAITEQLVSGNRTGKYLIYSFNGTTFDSGYNGTAEADKISLPNSVTFDGSNYWFDGGIKVIKGPLDTLVATTEAPPHKVTGVVYHDGSIYATTSAGRILKTTDGIEWTSSAEFKNNNSAFVNFSTPRAVTFGTTPTTILLAGTNSGDKQNAGNGYYEINLDLGKRSPRTISTETNFDTSLNGKSVIGMPHFAEDGGIRVFGLTIKDGLWSNYFKDGAWSGWARE